MQYHRYLGYIPQVVIADGGGGDDCANGSDVRRDGDLHCLRLHLLGLTVNGVEEVRWTSGSHSDWPVLPAN